MTVPCCHSLLSHPAQIVKKDAPEEVVAGFGSKVAKLSALKPDSIVILLDACVLSANCSSCSSEAHAACIPTRPLGCR